MTTHGEGLGALLDGVSGEAGGRDARDDDADVMVVVGEQVVTRGELRQWRDALSAALRTAGLAHRAIGVCMPNTAPTVAAWFAIWDVPATVVPLDPWVPAAEVQRAASKTGISALVTTSDVAVPDRRHGAGRRIDALPCGRHRPRGAPPVRSG